MIIQGLQFIQTGCAYPEQYEVEMGEGIRLVMFACVEEN